MNRLIILLSAIFSLSIAAVIPENAKAEIVRYENENDGTGSYRFSYETSNGITREETGHLVNVGEENEHMVVAGSFSYTDDEGKFIIVRYTADENGYQVLEPGLATVSPFPLPGAPGLNPSLVASLLG